MEGTADDLTLLLAGELVEVDSVARNADGQVGVILGVLIRLHQRLAVEHVDVDVVRTLCKVAVQNVDEVIDALGRMLTIAKEHGVTLCHENEAEIYGATPERCLDILNAFGGELGCVFDMGNFVLENEEPVAAYKMLRDHIRYFHIKDALYEGAIVPPGRGNAKIGEILTEHKAFASKDFFISLEPHLQLFSGLNALVGRSFENPYKYDNAQVAFEDAYNKLLELI